MKKLTLFICCYLVSLVTIAQISFAPIAGLNISRYAFSDPVPGVKQRLGVKAGIVMNTPLSGHFYLQPGALYTMNGFRIAPTNSFIDVSYNINTLEIPINVTFKTGRSDRGHLIASLGPYIGFNLWGSMKSKLFDGASNYLRDTSVSISFGNGAASNIRLVDYGANVNAGYESKGGLLIRVYYQLGARNIGIIDQNSFPSMYGLHSMNYGIGIGYFISKKPAPSAQKTN